MFKNLLVSVFVALVCSLATPALAGDFDWMENFNLKAEADQSGVKLRLGTSFNIGNADVDLVWSNTNSAADAFNVLAVAEIANRPVKDVLAVYQQGRSTGWGNMARSLGIKPGSSEFKALKSGQYRDPMAIASGAKVSIQFSSGNKTEGKSNNNGKNK